MFSVLSLTTIGYGRFLVPRSIAGRLFVIPYTLVGIPLVAVMYTVWAKLGLNWLKRRVKDITGLPAKKWQTTAIAFCAFFIILFVIGPAIFSLSENWLYYESVYFVWCTLSTIGYGDFVPTHHVGLVVGMILIPVGLGVVALVFAAISQYYEDLFIYLDYDEDVYTKQVVHRTPELRPEYGALDNDEELDLTDKAGDPLLAVREAAPLLAPPPGSEVDEGIIEGQPVAS